MRPPIRIPNDRRCYLAWFRGNAHAASSEEQDKAHFSIFWGLQDRRSNSASYSGVISSVTHHRMPKQLGGFQLGALSRLCQC